MTLPNFFIIGAQKAGTTSLYHYLAQHPDIYMSPVKEPGFFNYEITPGGEVIPGEFGDPHHRRAPRFSNLDEYRALFRGATGEAAIGEASPLYIYVPGTARRIKRYVPEAKIVALLRNPADRAYSAFLNAVRYGGEPLTDFARALREEEERIRNDWHYVFHYRSRGFYHAQLERYYELFGRERVGVWLYEELRSDPVGVTRSVLRFLGVGDSFVPDTSLKHNPSALPGGRVSRAAIRAMDRMASTFLENFTANSRVYPLASRMRQRIQSRLLARPPRLDPAIRSELLEGYREEILRLQNLIGRDLSVWLEDESRPDTAHQAAYKGV
ncbi:sulfotransferase [Rubrobacter taiwanensis]|jgi:hypothetical protein|uniref:Sulfotransferase n=1 Tax=Rubrobacter taiwanensis TaxID=185139 RepID=A0A4R1BE96_9ACTN|nr:sulfotransferase [Rubrobacter taiwanensis]TCJ15465.1 sulfotransferase [Rubrobacter taiwanensis]